MAQLNTTTVRAANEAVARLLGQHYGDRSVYLHDANDRVLLNDALSLGLVSSSGQLTTTGYHYWQSHQQS